MLISKCVKTNLLLQIQFMSENGLVSLTDEEIKMIKIPDLRDLARPLKKVFFMEAVVATATLAIIVSTSRLAISILDVSESTKISMPTVTRTQIFQASQVLHKFLGCENHTCYPCVQLESQISGESNLTCGNFATTFRSSKYGNIFITNRPLH